MGPRSLRLAVCAAALCAGTAAAQDLPPQLGAYMPLYPGFYLSGGYSHDGDDSSYDQQGHKVDTAAPQTPGGPTHLDREGFTAQLAWHFPLFESYHLPIISSRTYLAHLTLHYNQTSTSGGLADFINANPNFGLAASGSGIGDLGLEFGGFLYGSENWRTAQSHPLAVLLLAGINLPYGTYNSSAPNNSGSNTLAFSGTLGLHWQPWRGGFLEAAAGYRHYQLNEGPEFGQLAPRAQGADVLLQASLAQKVWRGLYLGLDVDRRRGGSDKYLNPQFATNPPAAPPLSDVFATPGEYRDGGTGLLQVGADLHYFIAQRWLASFHFGKPIGGRSGQFELPYTRRTPANCVAGALDCLESADGAVLVDGMGPARSFASDVVSFSIRYQFGQGDVFPCANCTR
jgi:outer membrane putative beta-barrel porin/alpha-amylase